MLKKIHKHESAAVPQTEYNEFKYEGAVAGGVAAGAYGQVNKLFEEEKFHARQGHGFAAEKANNLYDNLTGHDAKIVGDDNVKNGADRVVDGVFIQSKYCKSGSACVNECFDKDGNFDANIYVVELMAGGGNANTAVVAIKLTHEKLLFAGYAKEGLISQHTAKKAINKALEKFKKNLKRGECIMKNSKRCPKCGSKKIVRIPDNPSRHASGNNIYTTTMTLIGKIPVIRYVCCDCGYVENWVETKEELDKIKNAFD